MMTAAKAIEYRITQRVLERREGNALEEHRQPWARRLIQVVAAAAAIAVLGSYLQELLWVGLAVATAWSLAAD